YESIDSSSEATNLARILEDLIWQVENIDLKIFDPNFNCPY
ncbi:7397_t:CDS:1, partial [Dentiscutata erythropus]